MKANGRLLVVRWTGMTVWLLTIINGHPLSSQVKTAPTSIPRAWLFKSIYQENGLG